MTPNLVAKFVVQSGGCWTWTDHRDAHGYGRLKVAGVYHYAHRYTYEQARGAIPEGLQIDHLCRNRACVNPEHLEPVTKDENNRRGEGITAKRARQETCKWGHPFTEENTYRWRTSRICRTCRSDQNRARYLARKAAA